MAMEESESQNDFMQRLKSCSMTASTTTASLSSSIPVPRPNRLDLPSFSSSQSRPQFRHLPPSPDASKRIGIPPTHPHFSPSAAASPYPQISRSPSASQNLVPLPSHSRSLSQPAFFSLDSLPQFSSPSPPFVPDPPPLSSADVAMDNRAMPALLARTGSGSGRVQGDGLPPRKAHRRSQSDIPFGFLQNPSLPLPPPQHPSLGFPNHLISPREVKVLNQSVKKESEWERERDSSVERKSDGDVGGDDLFSAYMNLESLDTLNSSGTGTEEKREDSRASGTKTNNGADSSENEAESCSVNESGSSMGKGEMKDGNKRSAVGDPGVMGSRHNRSLSMDSFMGKLNFGEESPSATALQGPRVGQHMHSGSLDGTTNTFSLEFGSGEFTGAELKKIMANDKLAEIAMADPKRAKRILANRQSAARSKERKMRYISELEHKVQTLQSEATTLSAQLTLLQRDSAGFTSQNNELKFRLQAMEQQAQLRDALSEALTAEVQRLKLATGEAQLANSLNQQMQLNPNPQMYSLQHMQKQQQQQSSQISHYQMQSEQLQGKNNDGASNEAHK